MNRWGLRLSPAGFSLPRNHFSPTVQLKRHRPINCTSPHVSSYAGCKDVNRPSQLFGYLQENYRRLAAEASMMKECIRNRQLVRVTLYVIRG
jgi:hypothetical protein